jgi:hypothetical protein
MKMSMRNMWRAVTHKSEHAKFCPLTFGLSLSVLMGVSMFVLGVIAAVTGYYDGAVRTVSLFYFGYAPTLGGAFAGGLWAFIDFFCAGYAFAWMYNWMTEIAEGR